MLPTFGSAPDEMKTLFNVDWKAKTPAVNGGKIPKIEWQGVDSGDFPPADNNEAWGRITIKHGSSNQSTFGAVGERRYTRSGLVLIQIFAPLAGNRGLKLASDLAVISRDAFEGRGTASGIWFQNVRIKEIGPDEMWFQINVVAEFKYDEQR